MESPRLRDWRLKYICKNRGISALCSSRKLIICIMNNRRFITGMRNPPTPP